jgi:hypothetical protein
MIIKSATLLAFVPGYLTIILTLPTAQAQMGGTAPGRYGLPPSPYGYGPPPGGYAPSASMSLRRPRQARPESS